MDGDELSEQKKQSGWALVEPQSSKLIFFSSQQGEGGSAMTDFLKGASWGAWFILAGIVAAGPWAFVH